MIAQSMWSYASNSSYPKDLMNQHTKLGLFITLTVTSANINGMNFKSAALVSSSLAVSKIAWSYRDHLPGIQSALTKITAPLQGQTQAVGHALTKIVTTAEGQVLQIQGIILDY